MTERRYSPVCVKCGRHAHDGDCVRLPATAEPEPQDVEEARVALEVAATGMAKVWPTERVYPAANIYERAVETLIGIVRENERTRWAEREKELVEERDYYLSLLEQLHRDTHDALADRRAALGEERTTDG